MNENLVSHASAQSQDLLRLLAHLEIGWEGALDIYEDAGIVFADLV